MLRNQHITLRALEPSDVDTLYRWENDPEVRRVSNSSVPYSHKILTDYVNSITDIYADKQLRLLIERTENPTPLGAVDLYDCDFKNRRAGVGILIGDPAERGRGIGTQTLELLLPYAFGTLGFHQLYCQVAVDNKPSLLLFEKFGFERVGVKRDWNLTDGAFVDEVFMQKIESQ